ncbi:Hypothetical protein ABZS17I87_02729 [Kosakonia cowanii]
MITQRNLFRRLLFSFDKQLLSVYETGGDDPIATALNQ